MDRLRFLPRVARQQWRCFSSMRVDGKPTSAMVSVHDLTFIRGDGAFEVISLTHTQSRGVVPMGLKLHLDRLVSTCRSLRLPMVHSVESIAGWIDEIAETDGPGSCRIVLTRGQPSKDIAPKCIMLHDPPAQWPSTFSLKSMAAPWHFGYGLPPVANPPEYSEPVDIDAWKTIKWMSYAPNCLMTRIAQEHDADDALLLAADGRILDGPNFAVGFVLGGSLRLVSAGANRMLPSCTQMLVVQAAQNAGLPVDEGTIHIDEVGEASAAFAMSATRHVLPITAIDNRSMAVDNAMLCDLQAAYWRLAEEQVN